ncbi:putative prophage side tail fiber protein [Escherichia coli]|nr:putative prophage side tail fiber protein [Escherichia coli]SQL93267.1 putative prophage side tail fiber protein [Escherichia coli]SQL96377.1 putative prophage side tail fiber protein [Escherichia coli]SQS61206.1 putative prophage side tail fiber protein [Escherichia coli]SQS70245.1 putative prophage side tail fiber protein [Escherichia coli]
MEFVVDSTLQMAGFSPIFPDTCYHLTHYWPAAVDIPVANDNPVHYADPFVIMLEHFCKVLCCREPVWFEHDTDVVTLYRFH